MNKLLTNPLMITHTIYLTLRSDGFFIKLQGVHPSQTLFIIMIIIIFVCVGLSEACLHHNPYRSIVENML